MTAVTHELYISRDADADVSDHAIFCKLSEILKQPIQATGSGRGMGTRDLDFRLEKPMTLAEVKHLQVELRKIADNDMLDVLYEEWPVGDETEEDLEAIVAYTGDDEEGHLFTPRKAYKTHDRHEMRLSDEDKAKTGRGRWSAEVTDQVTGLRYKVRGASCGIPRCFCDAVVIEELGCIETTKGNAP